MLRQHFIRVAFTALSLSLILPGCLPFGETTSSTPKSEGGSLSIDDIYAATMALIATTQLSHVFVTGPDAAFDADAKTVATDIEAALKAGASCIAVSRKDAELTLDFGAGCAPPKSPIKIAGKVVASLSIDKGKAMTVTMALTDFGAAGKTASGAGTLTVSKAAAGLDVKVTMKMTAGDAVLDGGVTIALATSADKKTFKSASFSTVNPTKVTVGDAVISVKANTVTLKSEGCYPTTGTIDFDAAGVKAKLAFTADTSSTGIAKFTAPLSTKVDDKQLSSIGWKCD
ncbi:MAG: hypothetical protein KC502_09500 [Myxococcales bacterium]|nr:hypothetical protein [Myxococcales bacterium]